MKKGKKEAKDKESKRNIKDKDSKKSIKEKDSKKDLKEKDSKRNLKDEPSKEQTQAPQEVKAEGPPSAVSSPAVAPKGSGKALLSTYDNWNREKWSMGASEITKGLRSWNFQVCRNVDIMTNHQMAPMKVRVPSTGKKYIFEDSWVILHLEFILIWRNHLDKVTLVRVLTEYADDASNSHYPPWWVHCFGQAQP